jgi:hypothetical protein
MEFKRIDGMTFELELSRRNLEVLLAKLDDPASARTLMKVSEDGDIVRVIAVENEHHYSDRPPGAVYMPTSGEML